MRIILIIVLSSIPIVIGTHISEFYARIARVKRQASSDASMCLLSCIETMEEQLDAIKSVHTQRTPYQQSTTTTTCQRYEVHQLDALCGAHKEARQCLDSCPDGEMRTVGVNALTPLNFMCSDRFEDFKKYLPCLDSICEHTEKVCQPSCLKYKTSVDKLTEMQRDMNVRQTIRPPAVLKMVSDACEFIDCFNECSRPLIVEKCGVGAADLQRDTVKRAFSSITNLLSNAGASDDVLPSACRNLMAHSEGQSRNSTLPTSRTNARPSLAPANRNTVPINIDQTEINLANNEAFNSGVQMKMSKCILGMMAILIGLNFLP